MKIVNLTPHPVHIVNEEEVILTFPVDGPPARCCEERKLIAVVRVDTGGKVPVSAKRFGALQGLPDPQEGTIYIVSLLTAQVALERGRTDVFFPDDVVRDPDGVIVGCRGLARPGDV